MLHIDIYIYIYIHYIHTDTSCFLESHFGMATFDVLHLQAFSFDGKPQSPSRLLIINTSSLLYRHIYIHIVIIIISIIIIIIVIIIIYAIYIMTIIYYYC